MVNWRKVDKREDGIIVSTIKAPCMAWYGKYETAILFESGHIRIAKGYSSKEEALKGHEKYLNMTSDEMNNIDFIG